MVFQDSPGTTTAPRGQAGRLRSVRSYMNAGVRKTDIYPAANGVLVSYGEHIPGSEPTVEYWWAESACPRSPNHVPPFDITRLGHVKFITTDLERACFLFETGLGWKSPRRYACISFGASLRSRVIARLYLKRRTGAFRCIIQTAATANLLEA